MKTRLFWKRALLSLLILVACVTQALPQSRLRADGSRIVNASNQEVLLRGVGLGGWLLMEGYMMNPSTGGTQWSFKKRLYDQGQTDAQVETFFQSWRDNFITQADINWIADQGFNCVRIPMHYELFLTSSQRAVRNSVIRNSANYGNYVTQLTNWYNSNQLFNDVTTPGFVTLQRCLDWAAARGMYVIVDLHAAPGAQGTDTNISDALVTNDLWNRQIYQDITVRLWERIVARHINNNAVAFWDLINEPNNVPGGALQPGQRIRNLHERIINAIRAMGDTHLIMVEGNGWGNNYDWLEPFTLTNRSNLVYNAHRYWIPEADDWVRDGNPNQINRMINLVEFRARHNVPVWIGETGENTDEWLRQNVDKLNAERIGWAHWTYKRFSDSPVASLRRIRSPYLTDGVSAMAAVLENIKFANTIVNTGPLAAVDPRRGLPATCQGTYTNLPATIQAESFCTQTGVQLETTTDGGGGQNVGYIDANDWMAYRVNVPSNGTYTVSYRVASQAGGGGIRLERFGGGATFGTIAVPSTGGWQTWTTITHNVTLSAGQQDIAIVATTGGFNINWLSIVPSNPSFSTTIQAESYSAMSGIQTENCSEGGLNVGWFDTGDWLAYNNVTIPTAGTYRVIYRVASPNAGRTLRLEKDAGATQLGTVTIPTSGGWQTWTNVAHNVTLPAGTYTLGIATATGGFNINYFTITSNLNARLSTEGDFVTEEQDVNAMLFPNPVQDQLFIKDAENVKHVRIYNIQGQEIISVARPGSSISVQTLKPGLHIAVVERLDATVVKGKLVKR